MKISSRWYFFQVPWHASGGNEKYFFDNENVSIESWLFIVKIFNFETLLLKVITNSANFLNCGRFFSLTMKH